MSKTLDRIDKARTANTGEEHSTEAYSKLDISEYSKAVDTTHKEDK